MPHIKYDIMGTRKRTWRRNKLSPRPSGSWWDFGFQVKKLIIMMCASLKLHLVDVNAAMQAQKSKATKSLHKYYFAAADVSSDSIAANSWHCIYGIVTQGCHKHNRHWDSFHIAGCHHGLDFKPHWSFKELGGYISYITCAFNKILISSMILCCYSLHLAEISIKYHHWKVEIDSYYRNVHRFLFLY